MDAYVINKRRQRDQGFGNIATRSKRDELRVSDLTVNVEGVEDDDLVDTTKRNEFKKWATLYVFRLRCRRICCNCFQGFRKCLGVALNGNNPFACKVRLSLVNILAFCSFWFLFADQARVVFFPERSDFNLIIFTIIVWFILAMELIFEMILWPPEYFLLIKGQDAYAPKTARYLSLFHLVAEAVALGLFIPEIQCVFANDIDACYLNLKYSLVRCSLMTVFGPSRSDTTLGWAFFFSLRLRLCGIIRRWTKLWIRATYLSSPKDDFRERIPRIKKYEAVANEMNATEGEQLERASHVGTALMVINSYRACILLVLVTGGFPLVYTMLPNGGANLDSLNSIRLLQANNLVAKGNSTEACAYLLNAVVAWLNALVHGGLDINSSKMRILWLDILPVRCPFQTAGDENGSGGVLTHDVCDYNILEDYKQLQDDIAAWCPQWIQGYINTTVSELADITGIRASVLRTVSVHDTVIDQFGKPIIYNVTAIFNDEKSVRRFNLHSMMLQLTLVVYVLLTLLVLRRDAQRVVLRPIRKMLRVVLSYASDPFTYSREIINSVELSKRNSFEIKDRKEKIGQFETDQLIEAFEKVTDLLFKCWGVAGSDIISSNLARVGYCGVVDFNPLLEGERVYAIFAFACIKDFHRYQNALRSDVLLLINDIASIVHESIEKWSHRESGVCNRNLGSSFLLIFRVGTEREVRKRLEDATRVVFGGIAETQFLKCENKNSLRRCSKVSDMSATAASHLIYSTGAGAAPSASNFDISLDQLPGIDMFADKVLISILKCYVEVHTVKSMSKWKQDFRIGAGVGAFEIDLVFGLDAGWAIEGAVGSEHKIDCTYLSPHVNMASRMVGVAKQVGLSIVISEAMQELVSINAKSKLRHVDTVIVKGSTNPQKLFTYDAKYDGCLYRSDRSNDNNSINSSYHYYYGIFDEDEDLVGMRQHISSAFMEEFSKGINSYIAGDWQTATEELLKANELMIQHHIQEDLYDDDERVVKGVLHASQRRSVIGISCDTSVTDGPCINLINFMKSHNCVPPENWAGFRELKQK